MVEHRNKSDSSNDAMLGTPQMARPVAYPFGSSVILYPLDPVERDFFHQIMHPENRPRGLSFRRRLSSVWEVMTTQLERLTFFHWIIKPINSSVLIAVTMLCVAGLDLLYKWLFPETGKVVLKSMMVIEEVIRFVGFSVFLAAELLKNLGMVKR